MTNYSHKRSLPALDLLRAFRNGGRCEQVDMCSRARAQEETLVGSTMLTEKTRKGTL